MLRVALVLALATLPLAASAQSFRCVGQDGEKYDRQAVPPQCLGQPVEELNSQGLVVKGIDADLKAQEGLLASKRKEMDTINAKYDEDKKRYIGITKRGK